MDTHYWALSGNRDDPYFTAAKRNPRYKLDRTRRTVNPQGIGTMALSLVLERTRGHKNAYLKAQLGSQRCGLVKPPRSKLNTVRVVTAAGRKSTHKGS